MVGTRKLLRLADTSLLAQQLRLVNDNMRSGFWATIFLLVLLRAAWPDAGGNGAINLWCALVALTQIVMRLFIYTFDRLGNGPIPTQTAHRLVWWLMVNSMIGGALWGGLIWVSLHDFTLTHGSLVIAVIAVVMCGAVSTVSPLLPVFLAFIVPAMIVLAFRAGVPRIVGNMPVTLGCALYVATLIDQALKGARASMASIRLRQENEELLGELREESKALHSARGDAERASAAKSKVLAAASHDLRQPVHAQGLFLEVLAKTDLTEQQRQLVTYTRETAKAAADMLSTLFDFSRLESGSVTPIRQAFAIQPLLNKIEREYAPQADADGLNYRSRESRLVVQSDPALVELILRNLVSNAIRYTLRGGLLVSCRKRGDHAVLEVWDTGIGIAQSNQREVFREFHQLGNPERDRRKGFGLGLAIVEGLSRTLGHDLSVRSVPQRGSVFRLALPVIAMPAPPQLPPTGPADLQEIEVRILVLDDDESIQAGMVQMLESWGCECQVATSIEQAVALAARSAPDLVISDYRLRGERSGVDAIGELRALLGESLPTLLVTGDTDPARLREAAAHGSHLLHKPVSPEQLHQALIAALR